MSWPALWGIELRDWPSVIWTRLTYCRKHGHLVKFGDSRIGLDYCSNCGAPWRRR